MSRFFPPMPATRKHFMTEGQKVSYSKGQTFVRPEDTSPWVYYLDGGLIEISYGFRDGSNRLLGYFFPGAVFAQNGSFFNGSGSGLEYTATQKSELYRISKEDFFQLLNTSHECNNEYLKLLLANQFLLIERVAFMGENGIEAKVTRLLVSLALYYGHQEGEIYIVDVPITQETIARFTHATRESVSKTLRKLIRQNIIAISKKQLSITNMPALKGLLENQPG